MDMTQAIVPKSDQINAEDLLTGPRTFTIERVSEGTSEQPVNVHLVEMPGRPWRPSKSMSRVLVFAWGKQSDVYAGRRVTLYRDPEVTFGRDKVGGIKVSHMSHLKDNKAVTVSLTVTRGKRAPYKVEPLPDALAAPKLTSEQSATLAALLKVKGIAESDVLSGIAHIVGRPVAHRDAITTDEFDRVIAALESRPDADQ